MFLSFYLQNQTLNQNSSHLFSNYSFETEHKTKHLHFRLYGSFPFDLSLKPDSPQQLQPLSSLRHASYPSDLNPPIAAAISTKPTPPRRLIHWYRSSRTPFTGYSSDERRLIGSRLFQALRTMSRLQDPGPRLMGSRSSLRSWLIRWRTKKLYPPIRLTVGLPLIISSKVCYSVKRKFILSLM